MNVGEMRILLDKEEEARKNVEAELALAHRKYAAVVAEKDRLALELKRVSNGLKEITKMLDDTIDPPPKKAPDENPRKPPSINFGW